MPNIFCFQRIRRDPISGRIKNDPVDLELITLARNLAFPSRLRRESEPLPPLPPTPDLQGRYEEVFCTPNYTEHYFAKN